MSKKLMKFASVNTIKKLVQPLLDDPRLMMNFSDVTNIRINETPTRTITMEFLVAEEDDGSVCGTKFPLNDKFRECESFKLVEPRVHQEAYDYGGSIKGPCTAIELHRDSARA